MEDLSPDASLAGAEADSFDRYRVLEKIGEGGCGLVYRAEQLAPVRREVALKVIKLGMDTRAVMARFEAERQALALMDHPHIARVYDAGASRNGRPFFVMELVRGEPITDFCDRRQLPLRQRLELFALVCLAVQHAHQKGIIHRDLKPSNILVVEENGRSVPKVIDFGVAKATARQRLADQTVYTAFDQFVGTPAYMSPEQAGLTGADVDTRSDIYSLGVLLYELLAGRPPFDPARLRQAALDEICRIIREEEPVRPSERITTLTAVELTETARRRLASAPKLAGELRGDLDWLVMKALEKDPARRYATASDLAADLQRHLAHEPISAGPPGAVYRLQKFARRNRVAVTAGSAVLLALLAGLVLSTWFYFREKAARHWAETRAYASDIGLAVRMVKQPFGLGNVARLLSVWPDRQPDRRGWEWFYLNGLCHQELRVINADTNALLTVAWSPDGIRLASGGAGRRVQIWDATTGACLLTFGGHTNEITGLAWHPDGQHLASCGMDGTARIWEVNRAAELITLRDSSGPIFSLAWSPDGRVLATGGKDGRVKLWDAVNGSELKNLPGKRTPVSLSWSHDGSKLAAVSGGSLCLVWDVSSGRKLVEFSPPAGSGNFRVVAWSPNDRWLATGGEDFTLKLFDPATGTNTATFWGHRSGVVSVAWNADGTRLVSADNGDGTVRLWDVAGARMIRSLRGHRGPAKSVAWHPDGTRLASVGADGTIRIWDAARENQSLRPIRHPNQVLSLAWHPDGRRLAVGGRHDSAAIWDTRISARPVELHSPVTWIWAVTWNPDGSQLATAGDDNVIRLWQPDGREVAQLPVKAGGVRALAWSPDGQRLAYTGTQCGLNLLEVQDGKVTPICPPSAVSSLAVAWSPDGRQLAVSFGQRITLVETRTGLTRRVFVAHGEDVRSLVWSPDSRRLASASQDSIAKVWDSETGREITALVGHSAPVYAVAWSPDGTRLVTGSWDQTVKLWDSQGGMELCSFEEHPAQVAAVAFTPDGTRLASSDLDGNIYVRDATPGREIGPRRLATGPPVANQVSATEGLEPLRWYRDITEQRACRGDLDSMHNLAGFLATCPYSELREGRKAVEFGEKAVALTHRNNAGVLDHLAAAYAEAGNFAKAVAVQNEAIALLNSSIAKAEYSTRLRLYESNRPCRDYAW